MARKRKDAKAGTVRRSSLDRSLRSQLFDDEDVVMVARPGRLATVPKYIFTLGLYGFWRKRDASVLTTQRILVGKGIIRRDERTIRLDKVQDVTFARLGLYSYAILTVAEGGRAVVRRVGPMTARTARRFAKEVLRRL